MILPIKSMKTIIMVEQCKKNPTLHLSFAAYWKCVWDAARFARYARHFQVNAVYPKLISIPWVDLKANRIWGQLKESLRDFPNSGQIRENFFHIVSYFLGFFCMAGFSFSTSRVVVEEQQQPLCWGPLQPHGLSQTLLAFPTRFQRSSKTITMKASPTWLQKDF